MTHETADVIATDLRIAAECAAAAARRLQAAGYDRQVLAQLATTGANLNALATLVTRAAT